MKLYKFTKKEHVKSLFDSGSIRIGTLHDYNNEEKHGPMIGDSNDGVKTLEGALNGRFTGKEAASHPAASVIVGGEGNFVFNNCTVSDMRIRSPNMFIFSTSNKYTESLHKEWLEHENYDSCYEIFDPIGFFKAITSAIKEPCAYVGSRKVIYSGAIDLNSPLAYIHPAQIKGGEDFGEQCEVRAIWVPKTRIEKTGIDHLMVNIDKPDKYCCLHAEL